MANFSVTKYSVVKGTVEDVVTALETQLETVDNTKTIRLLKIIQNPDRRYIGVAIYDT